MRVAQLAPPWLTVPPAGYGGIEWVVHHLADGLAARGHEVTLIAPGGSRTAGKLHSPFEEPMGTERIGEMFPELIHCLSCYMEADSYDVIHDHCGLAGPALAAFCGTPVVVTLHGAMVADMRRLFSMIGDRLNFVAISESQRSEYPELPYVATIPNGIDITGFEFREEKQEYLGYVGRFSPEKGADIAVEVAHRLGLPLVLAGKAAEAPEKAYLAEKVLPALGPNDDFRGEVGEAEKREIFAGAKAMLFPIQWREPFGLVMAEAMACGTPVIAWRNGAVPEVVINGRTGFIVDGIEEMVAAVQRAGEIRPQDCREHVELRFSAPAMVDAYEQTLLRVAGRN